MKFKVNAPMVVDEGKHTGVITAIEYRDKPFEYTDIVIEFEGGKHIKVGYPSFVSPTSKLGMLMTAFGTNLMIGSDIEPETELIGKKCEFMTMNEVTKKGKFAAVIQNTLRPCL